MKIRILFICLFLLCLPSLAAVDDIKNAIVTQSKLMGVDPSVMLSLAKAESGFRQEARGASGTVGVFQLLPSTAKNMGLNPYNLNDNIKGGISYYKSMYNIFGSTELALAAYNSGAGAVKRCHCVPTHSQYFVKKIIKDSYNFKNY